MEWLIILGIVISIFNSISESKKAKEKKEARDSAAQRQNTGSMTSSSEAKPIGEFHLDNVFDKLSELMDTVSKPFNELSERFDPAQEETVPKKSKKNVKKKQKPPVEPQLTMFEQIEQNENRKSKSQPEKKRQGHKPLTASVQPLKTIYENDELCEHRIELNPNIRYQSQNQEKPEEGLRQVSFKASPDSLVEGFIWSEILSKPKAYRSTSLKR